MEEKRILVLGASGYIGSQLVAVLLEKGFSVRAAGRSLEKLVKCPWAKHRLLEIIGVDVLDKENLLKACEGCEVVYYLVHSINPENKDFAKNDLLAAQNTVETASQAGVKRIIYLGGMGQEEKSLSKHLRSRMEVLHTLHSGPVPVTTLRAAMVIGKGSSSFEILRCLIHCSPVLLVPWWISTESQPIAEENAIQYLARCLEAGNTVGQVFDIGGPDVFSYRDLIDMYAKQAGLRKRLIISVPPFFIPVLSLMWDMLGTPYPAKIVRPLVESLRNRVVCQDNRIRDIIPLKLLDCHESIRLAIRNQAS